MKLPDPDPRMTPEEVKAIYSHQYPELTTAAIPGPEAAGDHLQRESDWDEGVNPDPSA